MPAESWTCALLVAAAGGDEHEDVRRAALEGLAQGSPDEQRAVGLGDDGTGNA